MQPFRLGLFAPIRLPFEQQRVDLCLIAFSTFKALYSLALSRFQQRQHAIFRSKCKNAQFSEIHKVKKAECVRVYASE